MRCIKIIKALHFHSWQFSVQINSVFPVKVVENTTVFQWDITIFSNLTSLKFTVQKQPPGDFLCEKVFLRIQQNFQGNICVGVSFLIKLQVQPAPCIFMKKEIPAQMFSSELCQTFKNIYFAEHLWTTAADNRLVKVVFI